MTHLPRYDAWKTACPPEYAYTAADLAADVAKELRARGVEIEGGGADWTAWGTPVDDEAPGVAVWVDSTGLLIIDGPLGDTETLEAADASPADVADRIEDLLAS